MARTPPAEGYRFGNSPPDPHPTRSRYQLDQSFGWVPPAASGRRPRGGDWIGIGDGSAAGRRLFGNWDFQTGDQGRSRGRRRPDLWIVIQETSESF
jgi:hypothetical protein